MIKSHITTSEKCPYSESFWSVFSRIRSECGKIRTKTTLNTYFSCSVRSVTYLLLTWNLLEYIWLISRIILLSGDIETNPSPQHSFSGQVFRLVIGI